MEEEEEAVVVAVVTVNPAKATGNAPIQIVVIQISPGETSAIDAMKANQKVAAAATVMTGTVADAAGTETVVETDVVVVVVSEVEIEEEEVVLVVAAAAEVLEEDVVVEGNNTIQF